MRDWHKADIKAAIEKAGTTAIAIARAHGLHHSTVHQALRTRPGKPMLRVKRIIAQTIGHRPGEIWPSLFDGDDRPLRESRADRSTGRRRNNVSSRIQRPAAA